MFGLFSVSLVIRAALMLTSIKICTALSVEADLEVTYAEITPGSAKASSVTSADVEAMQTLPFMLCNVI